MKKIIDFGQFLTKINESFQDSDLVGKIDYTLLSPSATEDQIIELCEKADKLGVKSVCVLPKMVSIAAETLSDSKVLVCTVISFPHGTDSTSQKLAETKKAIADGADECDMVLNYSELKNLSKEEVLEYLNNDESTWGKEVHLYKSFITDVETLASECHNNTNKNGDDVILKVIVESGLLSAKETEIATHICLEASADFIKTSTGMVAVGAELDKVQIMRNIITEEGSNMKIKASGAIRTMADLQKFEPYVDRFGVGFGAVDTIFGGVKSGDNAY